MIATEAPLSDLHLRLLEASWWKPEAYVRNLAYPNHAIFGSGLPLSLGDPDLAPSSTSHVFWICGSLIAAAHRRDGN